MNEKSYNKVNNSNNNINNSDNNINNNDNKYKFFPKTKKELKKLLIRKYIIMVIKLI